MKSIVSFVLRWNPLFENLRALLAAGAIGNLFHVEADYWHGIGPQYTGWDWIRTKAVGRSATLSAGCHAADALRWFARDEAAEVVAFSGNARGRFEYDPNVVAIVKFQSGITAKTSAFFDCEMPYTFNLSLLGTEGTLRENRVWSKRLFPAQTGWVSIPTVLPDSGDVSHHPFDAQIDHFVDCIRAGRESHCNVADAYLTHELCLAIDRSMAEAGRPVKLPLDGEP